MNEAENRTSLEVDRLEAEYRRVLRSAVAFEKKIRDRWRQRCREKSARIAELEGLVARLHGELQNEREGIMGRKVRERKLVSLMVSDMGVADLQEREMARLAGEVGALSDGELDRTLAGRLGHADPERLSEGFTGAPDVSHEGRPEER